MPNKDPIKQKESQKKHYLANKAKEIEKAYQRKLAKNKRLKEIANSRKEAPCGECGGKFHPVAMDFHHLGNKDNCIGDLVRKSVSEKRLLAEIDKCEVLCSNCHRVRTFITDIAA